MEQDLKSQLRNTFKQQRVALTEQALASLNKSLREQLRHLDLQEVTYCHIFLPIRKFKEPDTFLWIADLSAAFPHLKFVVSRSEPSDSSLKHYLYAGEEALEISPWGIPEPLVTAVEVPVSAIDFVFIPLLVCDYKGNRIGYGKGFYDRFLAQCRSDVVKLGVSVFMPTAEVIPATAYDIAVDGCLCPSAIYWFKK